jgi:hypothetical protein
VTIGDNFLLKKFVEDRLDDANIDEVCAVAPIFLRLYDIKLTPCDGASPAYTFAPPASTAPVDECRQYAEKNQWTPVVAEKCQFIEVNCGVTTVALEERATGPTWNEDPAFLSCLDTIACACNYTTISQCEFATLADLFPPFVNSAFGAGLEHYNLANGTAYVQSQLRFLGRDPLPPCYPLPLTSSVASSTAVSTVQTSTSSTKYPPCPADDPIQCNFIRETCGNPLEYYIGRVIDSKWTDPEFLVSRWCLFVLVLQHGVLDNHHPDFWRAYLGLSRLKHSVLSLVSCSSR